MTEEGMSTALDAVYEETRRLLNRSDLPEDVRKALDEIAAIARYKADVRGSRDSSSDGA